MNRISAFADYENTTISFIIRTNSARAIPLSKAIGSAQRQYCKKEVIVCGRLNAEFDNIIHIPMEDEADNGKTSVLRDAGFEAATGDYLVAMDDDIVLDPLFALNIYNVDVQIPICKNITGGRFWDWCVKDHPEYGQRRVSYCTPYSEYHYLSGQCFVIKKDLRHIKHDHSLLYHQEDDVDYGKRLQQAGYQFTMNLLTSCIHFDSGFAK